MLAWGVVQSLPMFSTLCWSWGLKKTLWAADAAAKMLPRCRWDMWHDTFSCALSLMCSQLCVQHGPPTNLWLAVFRRLIFAYFCFLANSHWHGNASSWVPFGLVLWSLCQYYFRLVGTFGCHGSRVALGQACRGHINQSWRGNRKWGDCQFLVW